MKRLLTIACAVFLCASHGHAAPTPGNNYENEDDPDCKAFKAELARRDLTDAQKHDWLYSPDLYWAFTWENDAFVKGGDRHYTNGMKLSWLRNPCRDKWPWHTGAEWLLRALHKETGQQQNSKGVNYDTGGVFGMNIYTPGNLDVRERQRFDRPYVGWLYFGPQVQRLAFPKENVHPVRDSLQSGARADMVELQIGFIGPKAGQRSVQEWIHRDWHASSHIPQGWDNQVSDRMGGIASYTWTQNYWLPNAWRPSFFDWLDFRASVFAGGAMGNILRYANGGAVLAIGAPGEDLFDSPTIRPFMHTLHGDESQSSVQIQKKWALFVGTEQRYILHSIFVQGAGEAAHDISLVHHVYDVFLGASFRIWRSVSLTGKYIHRSVEFHSSDPSVVRPHNIGQIGLDYRF